MVVFSPIIICTKGIGVLDLGVRGFQFWVLDRHVLCLVVFHSLALLCEECRLFFKLSLKSSFVKVDVTQIFTYMWVSCWLLPKEWLSDYVISLCTFRAFSTGHAVVSSCIAYYLLYISDIFRDNAPYGPVVFRSTILSQFGLAVSFEFLVLFAFFKWVVRIGHQQVLRIYYGDNNLETCISGLRWQFFT